MPNPNFPFSPEKPIFKSENPNPLSGTAQKHFKNSEKFPKFSEISCKIWKNIEDYRNAQKKSENI